MKGIIGVVVAGVVGAVMAADPPVPAVTIELGSRQAQGVPTRSGFTHTGGGNIDVQQPAADTVVVTMTGVAVAGGHPTSDSLASLAFELMQEFEVSKRAKITVEARVVGLLRSHAHGAATIACPAQAAVSACGSDAALIAVAMPGRGVACGENLTVNDKQGPTAVTVPAGRFVLSQRFAVQATHPHKLLPCKTASAEFAPDPALDPLWISAREPFHGVSKKDFGFQVTVKVAPE